MDTEARPVILPDPCPQPSPGPLTDDAFLGGRLRLWQPARGYRAGMDALLLAAAVPARPGETVLDLGCGTGAAALALGATKWETTRVVLANGAPGILGAVILGLGRAIGETMAVTMVIGNRPQISLSLFDPAYTIASVIANEFTEATGDLYLSALIELGLILFLVTFVINALARLLVWSVARRTRAARA